MFGSFLPSAWSSTKAYSGRGSRHCYAITWFHFSGNPVYRELTEVNERVVSDGPRYIIKSSGLLNHAGIPQAKATLGNTGDCERNSFWGCDDVAFKQVSHARSLIGHLHSGTNFPILPFIRD